MSKIMTLTQLMEYYYKDDLSFEDIVRLLFQKKISLQGGMVSESDLKKIIDEKKLPSLDKRELNIIDQPKQPQANGESIASPEELEQLISQSEKNIFRLEKEAKRNGGNEKELINEYETMCNAYCKLYPPQAQNAPLERMINFRTKFKALLENAERPDKIKAADNLMKLGELMLLAKQYDKSLHEFNEAKEIIEEQINNIKMINAREKSECSAKLGILHYNTYLAKKRLIADNKDIERHLETAERLLARYVQDSTSGQYYDALCRIRREIQKCRKE